jgi:cytidyltransferase-like protein
VVATGIFDLLHVGHVRFLEFASRAGSPLVVGVEDDDRTRARKGPGHPLVPVADRCEVIAALRAVDGVFAVGGDPKAWDPDVYSTLLRQLRPAVLALTEGDPAEEGKRRTAAELGADVVVAPLVEERSTTLLAEQFRAPR